MGEQLGRMHWLEQNLQDRELDLTELKGKLQDAELELHRKAEVDVSKLLDAEREGLEMRGEREDRTRSLEQRPANAYCSYRVKPKASPEL